MPKLKILGVGGSPRKNGNTTKMVQKALEAAANVDGVETELYELAGKKLNYCIACYKCLEKGECVFDDAVNEFIPKFLAADGLIWGAPVYHMSVPANMKALLDRVGNLMLSHFLWKGEMMPRFNKVCGVLTNGGHRNGGQDLVLSFLGGSCIMLNGILISGETVMGSYIGASAWTGKGMDLSGKDNILEDNEGLMCAESVGKRVAEVASIVKAGMVALGDKLPSEYTYAW
ncbi:flavodoxin family protein [Candidatus Poribacteria bacterium]|nr:flavodoxin family protein [Candidatus Poribacteria bacterium]